MVRAWIFLGLVGAVGCSGNTEQSSHGAGGAGQGGATTTGGAAAGDSGGVAAGSHSGGSGSVTPHAGSSNGGSGTGGSNVNGGAGGAGNGDVPLASFPGALAQAVCSRTFECCTPDEIAQNPFGASEQDCKNAVTGLTSLLIGPLTLSQAAGRAEYDSAQVKKCLAGYGSTSCMDLRDPPPTLDDMLGCKDLITPKVALGQPCDQSYECIAGYCDVGVCTALKPDNGECLDDEECQSDNCPVDRCAPAVPESGLCSN